MHWWQWLSVISQLALTCLHNMIIIGTNNTVWQWPHFSQNSSAGYQLEVNWGCYNCTLLNYTNMCALFQKLKNHPPLCQRTTIGGTSKYWCAQTTTILIRATSIVHMEPVPSGVDPPTGPSGFYTVVFEVLFLFLRHLWGPGWGASSYCHSGQFQDVHHVHLIIYSTVSNFCFASCGSWSLPLVGAHVDSFYPVFSLPKWSLPTASSTKLLNDIILQVRHCWLIAQNNGNSSRKSVWKLVNVLTL